MLYIPTNLKNQNYTYYITNNSYITIRTNENCSYNYNTEYCDCIDLFPNYDYIYSNRYSCSSSSYNHTISYSSITDNYFYKTNIADSFIIFFVLALVVLYFPYKIFSRLFGRWLKV